MFRKIIPLLFLAVLIFTIAQAGLPPGKTIPIGTADTLYIMGTNDTIIKYARDATNDTTFVYVPVGTIVLTSLSAGTPVINFNSATRLTKVVFDSLIVNLRNTIDITGIATLNNSGDSRYGIIYGFNDNSKTGMFMVFDSLLDNIAFSHPIAMGTNYELPFTDGTLNQVLTTDGAGNVTWATPPGAGGGEANTMTDQGSGFQLGETKSGVDLPIKSIVAGTMITLDTNTAGELQITNGYGGDISGTEIQDDAISSGKILANAVTTGKVLDGTLQTGDLNISNGEVAGYLLTCGATTTQYTWFDPANYDAAYAHISNNGSDHSYIDQDVTSTSSPTFVDINCQSAVDFDFILSGIKELTITPSGITVPDGNISVPAGNISLSGTVDGVDVSAHAADASAHHAKTTALSEFTAETAWRLYYSNGSGAITALALGGAGTYLQSNGAALAPTFVTPSGTGEVNTSSSAGGGFELTLPKSTYDLPFKTITGGTGITVDSSTANTVNISVTSGVYEGDLSNEAGLYAALSDVTDFVQPADINTSAEIAAIVGDETGSGALVFNTSPTFVTSLIMGAATLTEAELEILDGATLTTIELNYVDGVTSDIQTQINAQEAELNNSAGLLAALSDETGTGVAVFGTSPTITTPAISGNMTTTGTIDTVDVAALAAKVHNEDLRYFRFGIADPNIFYDKDSLFCFEVNLAQAITITQIDVTCNANPTTQPAMSLRFATDFITRSTPTTIDDITPTAGVTTITSGFTDATIPSGSDIYLVFTADPEAALNSITFKITYTID